MIDYQGEKLKEYLESKKISVVNAANLLGVTRQNVYQYFKSNNLERETVNNILDKFNVHETDIWGKQVVAAPEVKMIQLPTEGYIPVYDITFTLGFTPTFIGSQNTPEVLGYVNFPELKGSTYVVQAKGDSMSPLINDRDFVGIRPVKNKSIIDFGNPYGIITEDLAVFKRIRTSENIDKIKLVSDNSNHDTYEIDKKEVIHLFSVIGILSIKSITH